LERQKRSFFIKRRNNPKCPFHKEQPQQQITSKRDEQAKKDKTDDKIAKSPNQRQKSICNRKSYKETTRKRRTMPNLLTACPSACPIGSLQFFRCSNIFARPVMLRISILTLVGQLEARHMHDGIDIAQRAAVHTLVLVGPGIPFAAHIQVRCIVVDHNLVDHNRLAADKPRMRVALGGHIQMVADHLLLVDRPLRKQKRRRKM
jgi:hypothetical protein